MILRFIPWRVTEVIPTDFIHYDFFKEPQESNIDWFHSDIPIGHKNNSLYVTSGIAKLT